MVDDEAAATCEGGREEVETGPPRGGGRIRDDPPRRSFPRGVAREDRRSGPHVPDADGEILLTRDQRSTRQDDRDHPQAPRKKAMGWTALCAALKTLEEVERGERFDCTLKVDPNPKPDDDRRSSRPWARTSPSAALQLGDDPTAPRQIRESTGLLDGTVSVPTARGSPDGASQLVILVEECHLQVKKVRPYMDSMEEQYREMRGIERACVPRSGASKKPPPQAAEPLNGIKEIELTARARLPLKRRGPRRLHCRVRRGEAPAQLWQSAAVVDAKKYRNRGLSFLDHPGGEHGPDEGGGEVRIPPRLQVLDLRTWWIRWRSRARSRPKRTIRSRST